MTAAIPRKMGLIRRSLRATAVVISGLQVAGRQKRERVTCRTSPDRTGDTTETTRIRVVVPDRVDT
jgi:hypothetical protein